MDKLLYVLFVVAILGSTESVRKTVTKGKYGSRCGKEKFNCVGHGSECDYYTSKCVCQSSLLGHGPFSCYDPLTYEAGLIYDFNPVFEAFVGTSSSLPLPCRNVAFAAVLRPAVNNQYYLDPTQSLFILLVIPWFDIHKGRIYMAGFDIAMGAMIVSNTGEKETKSAKIRVDGIAKKGVYTFREWGEKDTFDVWSGVTPEAIQSAVAGTMGSDVVDTTVLGVQCKIRYDKDKNFAWFYVPEFGIDLRFTPYDEKLGKNQKYIPGLSVKLGKANVDSFFPSRSNIYTILLDSVNVANFEEIQGLSYDQSMLIRAMRSELPQTQAQINGNTVCKDLPDVTQHCSGKYQTFMERCHWIIKEEKFRAHVDKSRNGNAILTLYKECGEAVCKGGNYCTHFKSKIDKLRYKKPKIAELTKWRTGIYDCETAGDGY